MALQVFGDVNRVDAIPSKFKWEIDEFFERISTFQCFESPIFTVDNGVDSIKDQCNLRLSLGLMRLGHETLYVLLSCTNNSKEEYNFKILNNAGVVIKKSRTSVISWSNRQAAGIVQFILPDFIRAFVDENKATILCEIIVSPNEVEEPSPSLEEKYEALFNNTKFSDVSLISEGKAVKAHKDILANSSSVFSAMFDAEMKEKQENIVEIADIKYDVLVEMVRFIYAHKVNNIDTLAGELAAAADKYALDDLKNTCEKSMANNLSRDNVIEYLQIADRLRMYKLKEKAIEFIIENSSHITDKPNFKSLGCDLLCEICCAMSKQIKP